MTLGRSLQSIAMLTVLFVFPGGLIFGQSAPEASRTFGISPTRFDEFVSAGEVRQFEIVLTNNLGADTNFSIIVEDIAGDPSGKEAVVLLSEGTSLPGKGLITVQSTVHVPQGQSATVPVLVEGPGDSHRGTVYSSVIISPEQESSGAGRAAASVRSRLGAIFLVRSDEAEQPEAEFLTFEKGNIGSSGQPQLIEYVFSIKNRGDVHMGAEVKLSVFDTFGRNINAVNLDSIFVLPKSTRVSTLAPTQKLYIGRYKAVLSLSTDYGTISPSTRELVFWIIPWAYILYLIAGLLIIYAVLAWVRKTFELRVKIENE